ncbi:hypothetical protein BGZ95_012048 [Linnemannia exigua]|uniref:Uncharacterized protein n=1 Tax=Linnemannia exigua TaxID=604196 RepID=A0AAD4H560_9FUNG|nr:hypothetical protein BGZ95_012048 [Linnemannia exigua]
MAPPKKQKMPSMKELQGLLEALDAEGGLAIGGGEESANLDDLFEDSYFYAILHNKVKQNSFSISSIATTATQDSTDTTTTAPTTLTFETLVLPQECSWGDDHETLGSELLVRPGYQAVLSAITSTPSSNNITTPTQTIFMATGASGIGKSSLAYFLVHKLFSAGHHVIISDPMFTNAFIDGQYYSCYSPHLEKHTIIHNAITATTAHNDKKKPTWWICDDGFLPTKGTTCNVLVTGSTSATVDKDVDSIRKKNKLALPVQFQIPKWSLDEIKAGLLVSMSLTSKDSPDITNEQEAVLETLFKKFKGNPKKTFAWVKKNWTGPSPQDTAANKPKSKSNKAKRS